MSARSTGSAGARRSAGARSPRSASPAGAAPPATGPASPRAACDPADGCITCSDEGVPMRVVETLPAAGLAICAAADGSRAEVMTDLVGAVSPGDRLLVHAGAALLALDPAPEALEADEAGEADETDEAGEADGTDEAGEADGTDWEAP